jgi:hypothetical protein
MTDSIFFGRIVGKRDNGNLLPEHEYEKLRREFYAKREQNNFHNVDYSWIDSGENTCKASHGSSFSRKKSKQSSSTIYCSSITPLELFQTYVDIL